MLNIIIGFLYFFVYHLLHRYTYIMIHLRAPDTTPIVNLFYIIFQVTVVKTLDYERIQRYYLTVVASVSKLFFLI